MKHRRHKGSGSVFLLPQSTRLYVKLPITGTRVATGLPDTPENRTKLLEILDAAYLQNKLTAINPFETKSVESITIAEAFDRFMNTYALSKQPKTQESYRTGYTVLLKEYAHTKLTNVDIVLALEASVKKMNTRSITKTTYLGVMRVFLGWCYKKKLLADKVDFEYIQKEHVRAEPVPLPEIYTAKEVKKLLTHLGQTDIEMSFFLRLILSTGLRYHEAAEMCYTDIDDNYIRVDSKDHKKRQRVPLHQSLRGLLAEIEDYNKKVLIVGTKENKDRLRNVRQNEDNFTMRVRDGKYIPPKPAERLFSYDSRKETYRSLLRRLDRVFLALGIDKRGRGFHEFRKTFISSLCRSGVSMDIASKIARCRIDVMMGYYRHFEDSELLTAMEIVSGSLQEEGKPKTKTTRKKAA